MARKDLSRLAAQLHNDVSQEALRESLLVPWGRLREAAEEYVEWRTFILWVRAITEVAENLPELVRSALDRRCPGYLVSNRGPDWRAIEEWIESHEFGDAGAGGWFGAVTYYAQNDLRTEQGWAHWERATTEWSGHQPTRWPTFEEWAAAVASTRTLLQATAEEARAVEALARVQSSRLRDAVSDLLESRAFAIWVVCVSRQGDNLGASVTSELRQRLPGFLTASGLAAKWGFPLLRRLVRAGDAPWCPIAREEGWVSALRYEVRHHPRYHRLIHYKEHCRELWAQSRPSSYPPFAEWLAAADAYYVLPSK